MARDHWLYEIAKDVGQRIKGALPEIVASLHDSTPFGPPPPKPQAPDLQQFLSATPDERHAFFNSIPPEDYAKVTGQLQSQAVEKFGAMAGVLMPLFQNEEVDSLLRQATMGQALQGTADINPGIQQGYQDLVEMMGFDPFK